MAFKRSGVRFSYAPQNEKSGCRLTFFVLRSIRFSNPLSLTRHPPFRGNAGTCCASLAEPGCLRCFDFLTKISLTLRHGAWWRLRPVPGLKPTALVRKVWTLCSVSLFVMPEKAINLTFDLTDADGIVLLRRGYSVIDRSFLFDIHYQQGNMGTVHMDFT